MFCGLISGQIIDTFQTSSIAQEVTTGSIIFHPVSPASSQLTVLYTWLVM